MWREIEADFLRDYGVQIDTELHQMSWRKFDALFSGLSPDGAVARALIQAEDGTGSANPMDPNRQRAASQGFVQWLGARRQQEG